MLSTSLFGLLSRASPLIVAILVVCLLVTGLPAAAEEDPSPRVVQGSDGTLYLITGNMRRTLIPDTISDTDLEAMADGGTIDG
jgi:hypothetical protein